MSKTHDFLVEIGTEELPPEPLHKLSTAFGDALVDGLNTAGLAHETVHLYASPRRLALLIESVAERQPDRDVERRGPPLTVAYDAEGQPTRAAIAFAKTNGVEPEALEELTTEKGSWLVYRAVERGSDARELLPVLTAQALENLPVPRRMRWGDGEAEFVRPVHWVVMLLGKEILDGQTFFDVKPGNRTYGHRFLAPDPLTVSAPSKYCKLLHDKGHVIADFEERRIRVRDEVQHAAEAAGGVAIVDDDLLEEVTSLVEWPVALAGQFDQRFLELPHEVPIACIQHHQRSFPVVDSDGKLLPLFVAVSNIDSRDPAVVRAGNERVIRPRLADAAFFWDQDRKVPLSSRLETLDNVVFQSKLGTVRDKSKRIANLSTEIATRLSADRAHAERAGLLCKTDLVTKMVAEFPELQGIMGGHYAAGDGEPAEVATAIGEHYLPRIAGERIPETPIGRAVSIADKLDTITGIFAIGERPTGTKDPFALRRNALGALRTMIEPGLDLDLRELLGLAAEQLPAALDVGDLVELVYEFMMDRLKAYYVDGVAGPPVAPEVFEAVMARRPPKPADFDRRVWAVVQFSQLEAAESLSAANKRIANILRRADEQIADVADPAVLCEPAEQHLYEQMTEAQADVEPLLSQGDYTAALGRLAALRDGVDAFFDSVMVLTEDASLRANRLALLNQLRALFLCTADLSRLQSG